MKTHQQIQEWLDVGTVHTSDQRETVLVWGKDKGTRDVDILGISINSADNIESYEPTPLARAAKFLSIKADIPFVWIGLEHFNNGSIQLGGGEYNIETLDLKRGAARLQHILGTDFQSSGTRKYINDTPNSEFDAWSKKVLPSEYVKTDLDVVVASKPDKPKHLGVIEVRRTDVNNWNIYDYPEDMPQHVAIWRLLTKAGLESFRYCIVQYPKSVDRISDSSYVLCTHVEDIRPDKMKWAMYSSYQLSPYDAATKVVKLTHPD